MEKAVSRQSTSYQSAFRSQNASAILTDLRQHAPLSRAQLARRIGLTKGTVSTIVEALLAADWVREAEPQAGTVGRPATMLEINPDGGCAVGVEVSTSFVSVMLANLVGEPQWQETARLEAGCAQTVFLDRAEALIDAAIAQAGELELQVLGIGAGLPGLVDPARGTLVSSADLGWRDVPCGQMWEARFTLPVNVDNEANAAALAESLFGRAQGVDDFVFLSIGAGLHARIGAGLMLGGALYRGASGFAGEVGHMSIDPNGPPCTCGRRGCWKALTDLDAMVERIRDRLRKG